MGDMLKLGAMKLLGPSKEEKQEEENKEALKVQAKDALYGVDMMDGGLEDILKGLTTGGKHSAAKYLDKINPGMLGQFGIEVDKSKISMTQEKASNATAEDWQAFSKIQSAEIKRITEQVKQQVDAYTMQAQTGIAVPVPLQQPTTATVDQNAVSTGQAKQQVNAYKMQEQTGIDQNAVPTVGQQPQIEEDSTNTGSAQNTLAEFKPESQSMEAELDTPTLLAELVRLQAENNRLLKKEVDAINSLDV